MLTIEKYCEANTGVEMDVLNKKGCIMGTISSERYLPGVIQDWSVNPNFPTGDSQRVHIIV